MRKKWFLFVVIAFVSNACTSSYLSPSSQMSPELAALALTLTAVAANPTEELPTPLPSAIPETDLLLLGSTVLFRDEFDGLLAPEWAWVNEDPQAWNLSNLPGFLQIQSEPGYINLENGKNVLMQAAPTGNYSAETMVNFFSDDVEQFAGIVLFASKDNFIQAGLGYCLPEVGCIRHGFYIDVYQDGKLTLPRRISSFSGNTIAIRMLIQDGQLNIYTSPNGKVWYRSYEQKLHFEPVQVGLFTGQNSDEVIIPASFGYFEMRKLP